MELMRRPRFHWTGALGWSCAAALEALPPTIHRIAGSPPAGQADHAYPAKP